MKPVIQLVALSMLGLTATCYADEPTKASAKENNATSEETNFLPDMLSKSHFDKDFSASVGLRLWQNRWNLPIWSSNAQRPQTANDVYKYPDHIMTLNSDNTSVDIPAIGLRYKNFFLGGSYFKQTAYHFNKQRVIRNSPVQILQDSSGSIIGASPYDQNGNLLDNSFFYTPLPYDFMMDAKREEWDVSVGYYINKYLMLTTGYKTINRHYKYTNQLYNDGRYNKDVVNINPWSNESDSKGRGLLIGISSSVPMGNSGLSLYGNVSYGRLKTTEIATGIDNSRNQSIYSFNHNNNYYTGEVGVAYVIPFKDNYFSAISMSLGYRFQRYEFKDVLSPAISQTATDTTDGFVAGINILF